MYNNKKEIVIIVSEEKMKGIEFDITGNEDEGFIIEFLGFKINIRKEHFIERIKRSSEEFPTFKADRTFNERSAEGLLLDIYNQNYNKNHKKYLKKKKKLERKNKSGGEK